MVWPSMWPTNTATSASSSLKWGQGAKDIGGEIQVTSLDYALFPEKRGYVVDPDPDLPEVQEAFENGAIRSFARHSRLGGTNLGTVEQVREDFMSSVDYLRSLGFKRISLKTGSYGMEELAMAIKFATDAKLDLLTIDGSGGGTGMSPWNMMQSWGVPSINLHAKGLRICQHPGGQGPKGRGHVLCRRLLPWRTAFSRPWPGRTLYQNWSAWAAPS
jgi:hypothetical protein